MPRWLLFSILTIMLWGLWGFESKLVVDRASVYTVQVLFTGGLVLPVIVVLLSKRRFEGVRPIRGSAYAFATGLLGGLGNLALYRALETGKASLVVSVTSLAPLVTVLTAAILLKERISARQGIGLSLALIAIVLMSV